MKFLVTGGGGFIGSHLVDALLLENVQVLVLDNFSTGRTQNLDHVRENIEIIKNEVEEAKKTFKKYKWPTIDVTRKSVEETAVSVIKIYEIKKENV